MNIKNVRVDARGIHGQVATVWIPYLQANRIMIIDDKAVTNNTQKIALKMAKPEGKKLSILSANKAIKRLTDPAAYDGERVFVLIMNIMTIAQLNELGYRFEKITLGNIPTRNDTIQIQKTIHLTAKEVSVINKAIEQGTKIVYQMVPNDPEIEINHI